MTDFYTPNLSLLFKAGISLTSFRPEQQNAEALLYRIALEYGAVESPLSYYTAGLPGFCLLRLKSGSMQLTLFPSEFSFSLSENSLYLLDRRLPRRIFVPDSAEYELLFFDGASLAHLLDYFPKDVPFWQAPSALASASQFLPLFEKEEIHPLLSHMLLTKLMSLWVLEHMHPGGKAPAYLTDIKAELEKYYYESHTLTELAQRHKVNKYRLCREFKSHFQSSPLQYLHKMRIRAAKELLRETDLKIHEISYEVGYENVNHFISHFKKNVGMTPGKYRYSIH